MNAFMKPLRRYVAAIGAALVFALPVAAMEPVQTEGFTLENGMEVLVIPNHRVPAVSHMIWFRIGSADEARGVSGLAHYLEHMMFKGTDKLKVGEYSQIMSKHGGEHNAFTNFDYTGYYVNIAKENLPLVMETEADRMVNLKVDDAEFLKERQVIMEERSMRIDNRPAALLGEQMNAALFLNHPYHVPVIGWRHEMEALSREQVFDMYHRYYHPNNVVLVVSGDITAAELKPLAEKYYGVLPAGDVMKREWTKEPPQVAERRLVLRDEKVLQPDFARAYIAPSYVYGEVEHSLPLSLLASILGGGQTSRLYQSLVLEQKIATSASAYYNGLDVGPSQFSISATPAEGVSLEQLEKAVDAVIAKTLAEGVTAEELTRAKTLSKAEIIYARDGLQSLAYLFGMLRMVGLDADYFNSWPTRIETVSAAQVQASGQWLLKPERSVTGYLLPKAAEPAAQAKTEATHAAQ